MLELVQSKAHNRARKKCGAVFNEIRRSLREIQIKGETYDLVIQRHEAGDKMAEVELMPLLYSLEEIAQERMTEDYMSQILRNAALEPEEAKKKAVKTEPQK